MDFAVITHGWHPIYEMENNPAMLHSKPPTRLKYDVHLCSMNHFFLHYYNTVRVDEDDHDDLYLQWAPQQGEIQLPTFRSPWMAGAILIFEIHVP